MITYEDLCDSASKKYMLNMAYNGLEADFTLKNKGIQYVGRIAMVAYDEYKDFPVWVAIVDNRSGALNIAIMIRVNKMIVKNFHGRLENKEIFIMSKIYMIAEAQANDETFQSEKFNQLFNPDTGNTGYTEVFDMTDSEEFINYENKDDFVDAVLGMVCDLFKEVGDDISDICIVAVDEETGAFLWGINILDFDEDTVQYEIVKWKDEEHFFKLEN